MYKMLVISLMFFLSVVVSAGKFSVYKVFGDHMVLQRNRPIVFSGTCEPGETVNVEFARRTVQTKGNADGEWRAEFPAMKAGGPFEAKFFAKGGTVTFSDILIGEVWVCAGQSNMEVPVWSDNPYFRAKNGDREQAKANYPTIRLYNSNAMRRLSPTHPLTDENGPGWVVCTPATVGNFSAVGFFFGRDLYRTLHVPVGLINMAWGGTRIEAWVSPEVLRDSGCKKLLQDVKEAISPVPAKEQADAARYAAAKAAIDNWFGRFYHFNPEATRKAADWKETDCDDSGWTSVSFPGGFPDDLDGIGWFRRTVELPVGWAGKELSFQPGAIDDCDEVFFNGVKIGETTYAMDRGRNRDYTVPAGLAVVGKNEIACRVADFGGGGGLGFQTPRLLLVRKSDRASLDISKGWKFKLEFALKTKALGPFPQLPERLADYRNSGNFPTTLYNAQVYPWFRFPVRGVIWYQGEANAGQTNYAELCKRMIIDWRKKWNDPEMPFLLVQLAGFESPFHGPFNPLPDDYWKKQKINGDHPFAVTREQQFECTRLPNVGMAVAMDVGEHSNIHPGDKLTVAHRLASEAERIAYQMPLVSSGPVYRSMRIEDAKIRVFFDNPGTKLKTSDGKAPGAFSIAGADNVYHWADAEIDGETVLVSSPDVPHPLHVRCGWAGFRGDFNLVNGEGFPVVPFRTDRSK